MSDISSWTEREFELADMRHAVRRYESSLKSFSFFARHPEYKQQARSQAVLVAALAKLNREGPNPVWDSMEDRYVEIHNAILLGLHRIKML